MSLCERPLHVVPDEDQNEIPGVGTQTNESAQHINVSEKEVEHLKEENAHLI